MHDSLKLCLIVFLSRYADTFTELLSPFQLVGRDRYGLSTPGSSNAVWEIINETDAANAFHGGV